MESDKDPLNCLASEYFGIDYLFTYQRLVISNILSAAGSSGEALPAQIVILPTGYGKSLCYMLPALLLDKPTIIISPLLSLIHDQGRRLEKAGIPFSILTGSMGSAEKAESVRKTASGESRILITNPESLSGEALDRLSCGEIGKSLASHIVIDEAHTAVEWGDTFRPALKNSAEIISRLRPACVTAFTATATPFVLERIREIIFHDMPVNIIEGNPDRSNIFLSVRPVICLDHDTVTLAGKERKPLIVFCASRTDTEMTARMLRRRLNSSDIFFYHAGLEKEEKKRVEKWFFESSSGILTATCAYGMGIDKPDIRTVIHRYLPSSVEAYLQESGRAGRDGKESKAVLIYPAGAGRHSSSGAGMDDRRRAQMTAYAENYTSCRREKLLSFFGAEAAYCSGCDICMGNAEKTASGEEIIRRLVRDNNRKLGMKDICSILCGNAFRQGMEWYLQSKSFAAMKDWNEEELKEGIEFLEKKGSVKKGKLLWKNLYYI